MGKFVVIVLDGFGVGAMPDVPQVRPADCGANTCVHIFERTPDLKLPNLASLGLANIVGREFPGLPFATDATFGRAELMHDGADTFFGIRRSWAPPAKPFGEPICNKIELIKKTLEDAGYHGPVLHRNIRQAPADRQRGLHRGRQCGMRSGSGLQRHGGHRRP